MKRFAGERSILLLLGVLAVVGCTAGVWRAVRAGIAQSLYYQIRYVPPAQRDASNDEALATAADRLYPYNYRLDAMMGQRAFQRHQVEGGGDGAAAALARQWCDRGLRVHPWFGALVQLDTDLLLLVSARDAIARWERHVDWQFWDPYNHAYLVHLYAQDGRIAQAVAAMRWVRGSEYEAWAAGQIQRAWQQEWASMAALAGTTNGPAR